MKKNNDNLAVTIVVGALVNLRRETADEATVAARARAGRCPAPRLSPRARDPAHRCFFFSSRSRHTISTRDWSSDVCSSDLDREKRGTFAFFRVRPEAMERLHSLV